MMSGQIVWDIMRTSERPKKKIKCVDGIVREYYTSYLNTIFAEYTDVECAHCGRNWGAHDYGFIKEKLKEHTCKRPN